MLSDVQYLARNRVHAGTNWHREWETTTAPTRRHVHPLKTPIVRVGVRRDFLSAAHESSPQASAKINLWNQQYAVLHFCGRRGKSQTK